MRSFHAARPCSVAPLVRSGVRLEENGEGVRRVPRVRLGGAAGPVREVVVPRLGGPAARVMQNRAKQRPPDRGTRERCGLQDGRTPCGRVTRLEGLHGEMTEVRGVLLGCAAVRADPGSDVLAGDAAVRGEGDEEVLLEAQQVLGFTEEGVGAQRVEVPGVVLQGRVAYEACVVGQGVVPVERDGMTGCLRMADVLLSEAVRRVVRAGQAGRAEHEELHMVTHAEDTPRRDSSGVTIRFSVSWR